MRHLFRKALFCAVALSAALSSQAQTRHTFANPLDVVVGNERAAGGNAGYAQGAGTSCPDQLARALKKL